MKKNPAPKRRLIINIYSKGQYPADALSNFAGHRFIFDGFEIASMESFLQSLKFEDPAQQAEILSLEGKEAKLKGSEKHWQKYLFWNGRKIDRFSEEYHDLLRTAYAALFQNDDFRAALAFSKGSLLIHTIGKHRRKSTVLTRREFINLLTALRKRVN